jgi:hypothetical protein
MIAVSLISLVLIVAIFSVPLLSVAGVWLGARRLSGRPELPRLVARVGYAFATVGALVIVGGTVAGVLRSMGSVSSEIDGPSQKARLLGESISEAMNCGALGFLVAVVGAVWLGLWAWRFRRAESRP